MVCFFLVIKLDEGRTTWQRTVRRNNNGHPILCSSTKIEEDMPGYGDTHCFSKNIKRDIVLLLCFGSGTRLIETSNLSIRINEKYTNKQKHHDYLDGN